MIKTRSKDWLRDLPKNHAISVKYVLKELSSFPGAIALIGSSAGEKYPIGRDIDLILVGLGIAEGKKYVRELYQKFNSDYLNNMQLLRNGISPQQLKYPLITELRHSLDDPEISEKQETIAGSGGTNITLAVRPLWMPYDQKFMGAYEREYKNRSSGETRTYFDIIVNLSFCDQGLDANVANWKSAMDNCSRNYFLI